MKILFVCTHNRCRSIVAEAVCRQLAGSRLEVRSAGSSPAGELHPLSLKYLNQCGYSTTGLRCQSWEEFDRFAPDVVITVCDNAAGESCPLWMGDTLKVHWPLNDPSKIEGPESEQEKGFLSLISLLEDRFGAMLGQRIEFMNKPQQESLLMQIGTV